ncbi:Ttll5 [Symbiodinium sp. CCMP2456]|nr:Ttll5 [Symbiodinium sp. CCMP2456]
MDPGAGRFWPHVPGYESDDDNGHEDSEAHIAAQARESLREVVKHLGSEWEELGVLHFKAPQTKLKKESINKICSSLLTPSFRIEHTEAPVVRDTLLTNGMTQTTGRDWLVQWSGPGLRDSAYQDMNEFQRVNHFPGSTELTRKDRLWMNFRDMAQTFGDAFDFVPQTFVLPGQMQEFLDCYQKKGGLWIVKPNASSRGRGIFVLRDVADLPVDEMSVVSRYVENPLLIQGLKFDLRVYVLVTSYEPLRAYIYREGLVRFASKPYSKDPKHLTDAYRHLTNYSINKGSSSFVENSEVQADNVGHKWSISALNKHLRCIGVDAELMWTRIMDAIVKSLLSVEPVIGARTKATANYSHNCFELYGFDVLVDQDLKPWLLEVNLSPSMQADSPLDWQIKSSLLSDSFNLVGINKVTKQRLAEATRAKSKVVKVPGKPPGPPERRRRHRVSGRSVLRHQNQECEVEDEQDCEDLPSVPLGTLDVEELRSTANALLECTRNRNFIRLYPTRKAVRHYAVIVDSQEAMKPWPRGRKPVVEKLTASQVLASLLFGPPPSHGKTLTSRPRSRAILCCSRSIRRREHRYDALGEDGGEETSNVEASPALRSQSMPRARARKVSRRHVVVMKRSPAEVLMTAAVEAAEEDPSKDDADKASTGAATPAKQEKPSAESERKDIKALAEKLAEKLHENAQAGRPVSGQRSRTSSRPGSAATVRVAVSRTGSKADSERRDTKTPTETLDEKFRESGQASRPVSRSASRPASGRSRASRPGSAAAAKAAAAAALAGAVTLPSSPKFSQKTPLADKILYKLIDTGLAESPPLDVAGHDFDTFESPRSRIRWKWLQLGQAEIEL